MSNEGRGGETAILRLIEIIYVTKKKYLKGVIWMSEFSMRATTFKNKFGVAPCDCWKNSYRLSFLIGCLFP